MIETDVRADAVFANDVVNMDGSWYKVIRVGPGRIPGELAIFTVGGWHLYFRKADNLVRVRRPEPDSAVG